MKSSLVILSNSSSHQTNWFLHKYDRICIYKRNEFYIASKHPLGETIINQTGKTHQERRSFLQKQYNLSINLSIQKWKPLIEFEENNE
jgi:hypothetical protein